MRVCKTKLDGLLVVEPDYYQDSRGYFMETWSKNRYVKAGITADFVQDNLSYSTYGVLRGLHFQNPNGQGKLVYVVDGEVFDVAVDIRVGSPTFGEWEGLLLSSNNKKQLYIPEGFAHGFCVLSEYALFAYKCTNLFAPEAEKGLIWNDPDIRIKWPITDVEISDKDKEYQLLKNIDKSDLPLNRGV